ncbi:MAG TPA: riboflavin synthase [Ignavibacteria bacterium]|nr:riboflavin synthase [Ignavibacteria bacterium]
MFTGIVQDQGKVKSNSAKGDSIKFVVVPLSKSFLEDINTGDSISVNGACMTVEKKTGNQFEFTTVNESLSKTNLGLLKINDILNLEKAMTLNSKLDGHIVQGHVDATGKIKKIIELKDSWEYFIEFSSKFRENIINIGSIAINGVSLTIANILKETSRTILIKVAIIPHTFNVTNFKLLKEKDIVNIEFDMLGKYVKRILEN